MNQIVTLFCFYQTPSTYYNTYIIYQCYPIGSHPNICFGIANHCMTNTKHVYLVQGTVYQWNEVRSALNVYMVVVSLHSLQLSWLDQCLADISGISSHIYEHRLLDINVIMCKTDHIVSYNDLQLQPSAFKNGTNKNYMTSFLFYFSSCQTDHSHFHHSCLW